MAGSRSRQLLHRVALLAFVAMLGTGIALRDVEAIAFAVAVLAGILLLPLRKGLLGRVVLGLVFLDTAFWMVPAAISNVRHGDEIAYVAVPVGLAAIALAGILAAVGLAHRLVPLAVVVLAGGAIAASQVVSGDAARAGDGDFVVSAKNVRFDPDELEMENGEGAIRLKNRDLFWHTFTIDELGVDLYVPVGGTRRATFEAPAGEYEFYCAIPGHDSAGMKGTLTVR